MKKELREQLNWEAIDMFMNDFMNDANLVEIFAKHGEEPVLRLLSDDLYNYNNKYDFRLSDMAFLVNHVQNSF